MFVTEQNWMPHTQRKHKSITKSFRINLVRSSPCFDVDPHHSFNDLLVCLLMVSFKIWSYYVQLRTILNNQYQVSITWFTFPMVKTMYELRFYCGKSGGHEWEMRVLMYNSLSKYCCRFWCWSTTNFQKFHCMVILLHHCMFKIHDVLGDSMLDWKDYQREGRGFDQVGCKKADDQWVQQVMHHHNYCVSAIIKGLWMDQ